MSNIMLFKEQLSGGYRQLAANQVEQSRFSGPIGADDNNRSPDWTLKETSLKTSMPPNFFVRFSMRKMSIRITHLLP